MAEAVDLDSRGYRGAYKLIGGRPSLDFANLADLTARTRTSRTPCGRVTAVTATIPPSVSAVHREVTAVPTNPDVDAWFADYEHPLMDAMLRVRDIILADDRMTEGVKWKSPTFMYRGNMASFNPRTKAHVSLMFHTGASIPGDHPRLEGGGDTARYMRFASLEDVEASRADLDRVVDAWCDSRALDVG